MNFTNSLQFQNEDQGHLHNFPILLIPQTLIKMMIGGRWGGEGRGKELGFVQDSKRELPLHQMKGCVWCVCVQCRVDGQI
jgi:hypothetical protein